MVAPFWKTKSLRSEDSEQEFQLVVKMTFLEYVPEGPARPRSHSAPPTLTSNTFQWIDDGLASSNGSTGCTSSELSLGSALHRLGNCKPCAWFWKPSGCMNGAQCRHCHLCPFGELGRRKRQNRKLAKSCRDQVTSPDVGETASASETETSPVNVSELSDLGTSAEQSASGLSEAPHPRRPVPRAQTWHMAPTPAARVPFFRAHTWQNSPNLQSVPEGVAGAPPPPPPPVIFLLPLVCPMASSTSSSGP